MPTGLKFDETAIGFKELKNETSLLVTITNCPNKCKGCHSPHLRKDIGKPIHEIFDIINKYEEHITAICFLGHGSYVQQDAFVTLLSVLKETYPQLKLGLYSGLNLIQVPFMSYLDYYKIGEYSEVHGGLETKGTNQTMYKLKGGEVTDFIYYY